MIEHHRNVWSQLLLERQHRLRRAPMLTAINDRIERHGCIVDFHLIAKRKDLKATRIGQDRPIPVHELVKPPEPLNPLSTRPDMQMIAVGKNQFAASLLHLLDGQATQRCVGSNRSKTRRLK